MGDWLTKADLQRFMDSLPDDVILCPTCLSRMQLRAGDQSNFYSCPNLQCLNQAMIPEEAVMKACNENLT